MKKYIIFGTGSIAKLYFERIKEKYGSEMVECFVESMLSKENFCGKQVIDLQQLKEKEVNNFSYLLGTYTSKSSMINELKNQGVKEENIMRTRDYGSNSFEENVHSVHRILLYPPIKETEVLENIDLHFEMLVPNIKYLHKLPEAVSDCECTLKNIALIKQIEEIKEYDLILVWNKESLEDAVLKEASNLYCIDPYFFRMIHIRILLRLNLILERAENKKLHQKSSEANYREFMSQYKGCDSYIFGAGPSCYEGAGEHIPNDSVRIVCNNFVDNTELINKIKPNIYVLSEEDSMSPGYINMIEKISTYVKENDCIFIVPDILGAVLIRRYPYLLSKLVRLSFHTDKVNFPSPNNMSVYRKAYNVITVLAIPVASFISDRIYITGCDGIDLENHIFNGNTWEHDEGLDNNQSFKFSIRANEENWDKEYYFKHVSYFEEILEFGERVGKRYICFTDSFITALKKRKDTRSINIGDSCFEQFKECLLNKKLYIYGASGGCKNFLTKYGHLNLEIEGIIDSDNRKKGTDFCGYKVNSKEILSELNANNTVILITSIAVEEIYNMLIKTGMKYIYSASIMRLRDEFGESIFKPFRNFNKSEMRQLQQIRKMLEDEKSKWVFDKLIDIRNRNRNNRWYSICSPKQYFCEDIFKFRTDEVMVDGGAYDGDTALEFIKTVKNEYKKIYSFEPNKELYNQLLEKNIKSLIAINSGLGSKKQIGNFKLLDHGSSTVSDKDYDVTIDITCIDEVVEEKVTYIKLDIEGSELEALKGSKKIIQRDKPKLAVCLYHKPEDIIEIPLYLKSLVPEYRFYMRHHSVTNTETVLYAQI